MSYRIDDESLVGARTLRQRRFRARRQRAKRCDLCGGATTINPHTRERHMRCYACRLEHSRQQYFLRRGLDPQEAPPYVYWEWRNACRIIE